MKDGKSALVDFKKVFRPSDTSTSAKAPAEHYLTMPASQGLRRALRHASAHSDQVIAPAHVVYGFLVGRNGDAARWMCGQDNSAEDVITLLGDRVFGLDLPDYRGLKPILGDLNKFTPKRAKSGGRHRPAPGREFLETLEAAYQDGKRNAGFTLEPPDAPAQRERGQGGATEVLGMGYSATVSEKLAAALRTGAALAYHLGELEFSPAHVLYAMLYDHDSDRAKRGDRLHGPHG
jgi:hypothetical protein